MKTARGTDFPFKLNPVSSIVTGALVALYATVPLAHAGALPSGGHFVAGSGSINGNATSLTIDQNSFRGIVDWNSFSIGNGNHVSINNGNGATLNRVTGGSPSSIYGALSATGSVYLINPQGVVIGPSGVISTGGRFVASTLDTDNASFMNGGPLTLTGASNANVVNLGRIGSTHGDVFLLATGEVKNLGSIHAAKGTAELAAGKSILLHDSSTGRQVFVQLGSAGTVLNRGDIEAAQIDLQAADGNVFALSGNHAAIRATGTAKRDGHVWLVADSGTVKISSGMTAENADGSGGTVDTLADALLFCQCGPTIQAGVWNVTASSLTIDDNAALSFSRSLNAGTSINVQAIGSPNPSSGDINVATTLLGWNGAASLDLSAYHSVLIAFDTTIKNVGTGNLTLRGDSTAIDNGGTVGNPTIGGGTIDWSQSTGTVRLFYDSSAAGALYNPPLQLSNPAWVPVPYSPVRTQITAYQLVNKLSELQAINDDLSGNYALGRDIDASTTSDGSFVPIGDGNTPFSGLFDGMGHRISSLTLTQTVPFVPPGGSAVPVQGLFGVIGNGALVRGVAVDGTGHVTTDSFGFTYGILAGVNEGTIENVSASGNIVGPLQQVINGSAAGGLVGTNYGNVARSSSSVDISAGSDAAGGLVGINDGVISQSDATGPLDGTGDKGGLVGDNYGAIIQSYATGSVQTQAGFAGFVGGLAGSNGNGGLITQSYATGSVQNGGGGLVGANDGTISQSFATGAVAQDGVSTGFGGIAGVFLGGSIGNDVYWNAETTGLAVAVGSQYGPGQVPPSTNGLTTAQMSTPSSFVGYDFGPNGVWAMPAGSTHPVLAWQLTPFH